MFCKKCGTSIDDDSTFCYRCGEKQYSEKDKTKVKFISDKIPLKTVLTNKDLGPLKFQRVQKNQEAIAVGYVIFFVTVIIFIIFYKGRFEVDEAYLTVILCLRLASLIIRFVCANWIYKIAKDQNRNKTSWTLAGFLFPSIALIVIGYLGKIIEEEIKPKKRKAQRMKKNKNKGAFTD